MHQSCSFGFLALRSESAVQTKRPGRRLRIRILSVVMPSTSAGDDDTVGLSNGSQSAKEEKSIFLDNADEA